jgi:hypothetical protein
MEQSLTPELQAYYENQFSMLASQGWKDLLEDFAALRKQVDVLSAVKDSNDLWYRKGQLDILDLFLNRKAQAEKVYEDLINVSSV